MPPTIDRISTGFEALDQELGEGIPTGSLVAVRAPPSAPVDLLLARVMTPETFDRGVYLTTVTPPETVATQLTRAIPDAKTRRCATGEMIPDHINVVDARTEMESKMEALTSPADAEDTAPSALETSQMTDGQSIDSNEIRRDAGTDGEDPSAVRERSASSDEPSETTSKSVKERASAGGAQSRRDTPGKASVPILEDDTTADASKSETLEGGLPEADAPTTETGSGHEAITTDQPTSVVRVLDSISDVLDSADGEQLLEQIATHPTAQQGATYLHLRIPDERPPTAVESRVLQRADVVFEYQLARESDTPDELVISKLRGGTPPERCFPLEVTEHIGIKPDRRM